MGTVVIPFGWGVTTVPLRPTRAPPDDRSRRLTMIEPNPVTRTRWCPHCLARMRVSRNPYYGVGLAVHQHLSSCPRCGYVEFLRGAPRRTEAPPVAEAPRPASFADRVRTLAARLLAVPRGGAGRAQR